MSVENKTIKIEGQSINYQLKRRRQVRYVRLAIKSDATLSVTAPSIYPLFLIQNFIRQKWQWIKDATYKQRNRQGLMHTRHTPAQIRIFKKQTYHLVLARLAHYNQYYHYQWNRIAIRNQSSRWGSCSSKKNLNFNYRLSLLPPELADYIIVHELCHLGQMNHSRQFWALVARVLPDYKNSIKIIKKIG